MLVHWLRRFCLAMLFSGTYAATVLADASLYVSLQDSYLNDRIEQLRVAAQMPTMRKPYAVSEVRHYLNRIRSQMPGLYTEIDARLQRYEQSFALTSAELTVATARETDHPIVMANARGESLTSHYHAGFSAAVKPFQYLALSLGANKRQQPDDSFPLDSYLVLGGDAIQLDIGYREHWLSPFDNGAMLYSSNAKAPLSITISNPLPYQNWWQIQYEIFIARLDKVPVYSGTQWEFGNPVILGSQFSFSPFNGWNIALTRTMQFGGGSRKVNTQTVWDAFTNPSSDHSSEASGQQCDGSALCEFGNQQAAISSRIDFPGTTPFSIYFEYGGEDSAGLSNDALANLSASIGLYIPFMPSTLLGPDWSFRYEYQQWQDGWYVHSIYPQGYSFEAVTLGHWGANYRQLGDAVGATAQSIALGKQLDSYRRYELRFKQLQNENYGAIHYHTHHDMEWRYFDRFWGQQLSVSLLKGRDVYGEKFWRVETQWSW